ncbi:MAG: PQQ-binding-like beta-propeller repeat protein [Spirochaetales bacterium]|nr:PQQ-binding-like beta-propeller repeat protein [Spirochaetales bacterium]
MAQKSDNEYIKHLVKTGSGLVPVPKKTNDRVLAAIAQKTREYKKPRLITLIKYSPGLSYAAAALIAVPIAAILTIMFLFSGSKTNNLTIASNKGGIIENRNVSAEYQKSVSNNDIIVTGSKEQVTLENGEYLAVHVFTNSRLQVNRSKDLNADFTLQSGSVYINKNYPVQADGMVAVRVGDISFTLSGTRAYFSVDEKHVVTVICYEGMIAASRQKERPGEEPLPVIKAGNKAVIANGIWRFVETKDWSNEEKRLDKELEETVSPTELFQEISAASAAPQQEPEQLPPYSVTRIAKFSGMDNSKTNYFTAIVSGTSAYIFSPTHYVILSKNGSVSPQKPYPAGIIIKNKPALAGTYLCLPSTASVEILDAVSGRQILSVPLPKDGSIDHSYNPVAWGALFLVPIQNKGYFLVDPAAATPMLELFKNEPFPVSPVPFGEQVYLGSYYSKNIGLYTKDKAEVFIKKLSGNPFSNSVKSGNSLFVAATTDSETIVSRLNSSGTITGTWKLGNIMTSDFFMADSAIIGVTADGRILLLDIASGRISLPARVYPSALSSRVRRNLFPALLGSRVYAGTDKGNIIVIDLFQGKTIEEIEVASNGIFSPLFVLGNNVHAVSNDGSIYRVVKNAE